MGQISLGIHGAYDRTRNTARQNKDHSLHQAALDYLTLHNDAPRYKDLVKPFGRIDRVRTCIAVPNRWSKPELSYFACVYAALKSATYSGYEHPGEMREYIVQHDYVKPPSAVKTASAHKLYKATMKEVEKRGEDARNVSWPIFLILSAIYGRLPKGYTRLVRSLHGTTEISDHTTTYFATVRDPNDTSRASATALNGSTSSSILSATTIPERTINQARRSMAVEVIADETMSGPSPRDDDEHNTIIVQSSDEESPNKNKVQGGTAFGKRPASTATHEAGASPTAKRHRKASRRPSNMAEVVDGVESSLLGQSDESTAGRCSHGAEIRKEVKRQVKKETQKMVRILSEMSEMIKLYSIKLQHSTESASSDEYAPSGSDESDDDA